MRLFIARLRAMLRHYTLPPSQRSHLILYRGISVHHPTWSSALRGVVYPRKWFLGHRSAERHNRGDTGSVFTSWSTDRDTALIHMGDRGILLEARVPLHRIYFTFDEYAENEALVKGLVRGAKVEHVTKDKKDKQDEK